MKIYFYSKLKQGAWGGGNQFLKALQKKLTQMGICTDSVNEADSVLFNGYQDIFGLFNFWFKHRNKKRIYRLGPILYLHRGWKWKVIDYLVIFTANMFADLVMFQSQWSYNQSIELGFNKNKKYTVVSNAVDDEIFFKTELSENKNYKKIKLIYTSWSANLNKGFKYLDFLDKNLDFSKFEMKFIGHSPIEFKKIEMVKPLSSKYLAENLRLSDIFISPIKDDACSNAILEALACGLPVVALDSGSNSELVGKGGELFRDNSGLMDAIDLVAGNLLNYKNNIKIKNLSVVAEEYIVAIKNLC